MSELDPTLTNLADGHSYDQLNDDTFGSGALGIGKFEPFKCCVEVLPSKNVLTYLQARQPRV